MIFREQSSDDSDDDDDSGVYQPTLNETQLNTDFKLVKQAYDEDFPPPDSAWFDTGVGAGVNLMLILASFLFV